jgi:hypothetical protein
MLDPVVSSLEDALDPEFDEELGKFLAVSGLFDCPGALGVLAAEESACEVVEVGEVVDVEVGATGSDFLGEAELLD